MNLRTVNLVYTAGIATTMLLSGCSEDNGNTGLGIKAQQSVVKIHVSMQNQDYSQPWQGGRPTGGKGTGFIIGRKRILTNAHVVSDARFLRVQKHGDSKMYEARVIFSGHDCDLAVLTVDDPKFFKGTSVLELAEALPGLNAEVTVIGYPMGGARLSVTRGVVSRIEYNSYTHSGVDQHLALQVDAAINPGNSGGPIMYNSKVVALAFQGLLWAENIGYGIPISVIRRFLEDIEDGEYNGYPELGVAFMDTLNSALRDDLKLTPENTGVVIFYLDPFGSANKHLMNRDVLLSIDGYKIENDGSIEIDGNKIIFAEMLERKQWGDISILDVWRDGKRLTVEIPLINLHDPFIYRNLYDRRPEYYINGGLVFCPLNREYLRTIDRSGSARNHSELVYHSQYAKIDNLYTNREEFVVLTRLLPDQVNTYTESFLNGIIDKVNNINISSLKDVKKAFAAPVNGFHVLHFKGIDESMILDANAVSDANSRIFSKYRISSPEYFLPPSEGRK